MLTRWQVAICALAVLLSAAARADYVEAQRRARVRERPETASSTLVWVEEGDQLALIHDETPYYYCVRLPDGTGNGWIARSVVRRYLGDLPGDDAPSDEGEETGPERHLRLGKPQAVHEYLHEGYAGAVDARLKIPVWVQYVLTAEQIEGSATRQGRTFSPDPAVPVRVQATDADYYWTLTGLAKGHMAPADDFKYSQTRLDQTFWYSNACPQIHPAFNSSTWRTLEQATHDWVELRGDLTIIAGPIFTVTAPEEPDPAPGAIKGTVSYQVMGNSRVAVPTAFYKIIADATEPLSPEVLAFIMPHEDVTGRPYSDFLCSVEDVERATGLDFLSELDDTVEEVVEGQAATQPWPRD